MLEEKWDSISDSRESDSANLINRLSICGQHMLQWSKRKFGNISRRVQSLNNQISQLNSHMGREDNKDAIRSLENQLDHLLALNESYWKQQSRADWLKSGDHNTKFFHHKASIRRQKNRITGIKNSAMEWTTNPDEVHSIISNFFINLFVSSNPSQDVIEKALAGMEKRITDDMKCHLDMNYTAEEVRISLFGMAPWKAP